MQDKKINLRNVAYNRLPDGTPKEIWLTEGPDALTKQPENSPYDFEVYKSIQRALEEGIISLGNVIPKGRFYDDYEAILAGCQEGDVYELANPNFLGPAFNHILKVVRLNVLITGSVLGTGVEGEVLGTGEEEEVLGTGDNQTINLAPLSGTYQWYEVENLKIYATSDPTDWLVKTGNTYTFTIPVNGKIDRINYLYEGESVFIFDMSQALSYNVTIPHLMSARISGIGQIGFTTGTITYNANGFTLTKTQQVELSIGVDLIQINNLNTY